MRVTRRMKGRVTLTRQEHRKRTGAGTTYVNNPGGNVRQFVFDTSDFTSETVHGETAYRIDVDHNLFRTAYIWQCFKSDNNAAVIPFDWHQGEQTLKLWFHSDTLNITVNVAG
jgi:hypothetical protein